MIVPPVFDIGRSRYGVLTGPSRLDAMIDGVSMHPVLLRPICNILGLSERFKHVGVALVSLLSCRRGPLAIFGAVMPIVINSFYRVFFGWARPHVGKEHGKVVPPIADSDPPSTVLVKSGTVGVSAPIAHAEPAGVCRVFPLAVRHSSLSPPLHTKAPARLACAIFERSRGGYMFVAAVASAKPFDLLFSILSYRHDDHKPIKFLAGNIFCSVTKLNRCVHKYLHMNKSIISYSVAV